MRSGVLHARPTSARLRRRWPARPSSRAESAPATRLFFVRHASHDLLDHVLVGRGPDVPLSAAGIEEAYQVAAKLAKRGITRVHTSPRQRAVETANMIARTAKAPLQIAFALDEIDLGAWTGLTFAELEKDPRWHFWNMMRSLARPPEGESMREVQDRILAYLTRLHTDHLGARIALVTHAEVIRAAILYCEGRSLDAYAEVKISPAEIVEVVLDEEGARVAALDEAS